MSGFHHYPSGYPSNHFFFYQPDLEKVLRDGLERYQSVTTIYDTNVTDVQQNEEGVTISSEGEEIAKASYLIACDGANSFTRNWLGIGLNDLGFEKKVLKVDALDTSGKNPTIDTVQKICGRKMPWVRMQGVGKHRRWELNFDKGLTKNEIENIDVTKNLLEELSIDTSHLEILHSVQYHFRSVLAKQWHQQNVFIAGDAAHTTPPYVGQGMGAGFRDIINLSWKIDGVLKNRLSKNIFRTYQRERYPHAKKDILKAIGIGWLFTTRLWYLLKVISKIPVLKSALLNIKLAKHKIGPGFFGSGKAARKLFPQIKMAEDQYSDRLFENQWVLVSMNNEQAEQLPTVAKQFHLKSIHFKETLENYPILKAWCRRQNAQYFIVRPDLYVFSSGNDPLKLGREYQQLVKKL